MKTVAPKVLLFLPDLSRNTFSNKCLSKIALNAELNESTEVQTLGVFLGIDRSIYVLEAEMLCLCVLCKYVNGNVYKHSVLQ